MARRTDCLDLRKKKLLKIIKSVSYSIRYCKVSLLNQSGNTSISNAGSFFTHPLFINQLIQLRSFTIKLQVMNQRNSNRNMFIFDFQMFKTFVLFKNQQQWAQLLFNENFILDKMASNLVFNLDNWFHFLARKLSTQAVENLPRRFQFISDF